MRRLYFCILIFLLFFIATSVVRRSVYAAKFGVNIAGKYDDFDQAVRLVGKGGWIVVMSPPDQGVMEWINKAAQNDVNLIIRASHPGDNNFSGYAERWARLFRDIPAANFPFKIYFVPVNEPNNTQEGITCAGVKPYVQEVVDFFTEYGLKGTRVDVLSPALDAYRLADNNMDCFKEMGGVAYFKQFDGIVFHAYGQVNSDGSLQADAHAFKKGDTHAFLSAMGLATSTPVYIVETGVVCPGCPVVDEGGKSIVKYPFTQKYKDMILGYWDTIKDLWNASNVKAFTIISYDPPDFSRTSWINNAGSFGKAAQELIGGGDAGIIEAGELTPGEGGGSVEAGTPTPATPCGDGIASNTCAIGNRAAQVVPGSLAPTQESCNVFESALSYFGLFDCKLTKIEHAESPQVTIVTKDKSFLEIVSAWLGYADTSNTIKTNLTPYSITKGAAGQGSADTTKESGDAKSKTEEINRKLLDSYTPYSLQQEKD